MKLETINLPKKFSRIWKIKISLAILFKFCSCWKKDKSMMLWIVIELWYLLESKLIKFSSIFSSMALWNKNNANSLMNYTKLWNLRIISIMNILWAWLFNYSPIWINKKRLLLYIKNITTIQFLSTHVWSKCTSNKRTTQELWKFWKKLNAKTP